MSNDYDEEVVATGDLHKKNLSGRKAWNLRRFALIGANMVYYKEGVKRGEWNITGCVIKKLTAEECNQPAAKYAFVIEGNKKSFMFSANSEKNRDKWIDVLNKQIEEFKDVARRFIRRGEIILGTGGVKRKNLFGKSSVQLIVSNFPRLLVIDSSTLQLKDQILWTRGQSTFQKLDKTKFKVISQGKEFAFEDPENGMLFWENVFRSLDTHELFIAKRYKVVKIGLPGSDDIEEKKITDPKQLRAAQNLQFLEEGAASITQLMITLNTKIDSIDSALAQAISDGWIVAPENAAVYQERLVKRTQFEMLKENVDLIADNLEKLATQTKKSPLTTAFDRVAIQNVIEEASTLLALLNTDEEEDDDADDEEGVAQFGDEVNNMDSLVAEMDNDNLAAEEIIANVEFLSLFDDTTLQKLNENFDDLTVTNDVTFTADNFVAEDIAKRPPMWKDIRTKRLLINEYVMRLEGALEDDVIENRKTALAKEEVVMVEEVKKHHRLLNLEALTEVGGIEKAAMAVTLDNFDPNVPDQRPPAWKAIRLRRAIAREDITKNVEDAEYVRQRPTRVMEEEKIMLSEIAQHGHVLTFGSPSENPDRVNEALNNENNERVVLIRERANTMRERAYTIRDKETIGGGRTRVASNLPVYRGRASSLLPSVTNLNISADSFDPYDENVRPEGWMELRMKRVVAKEEKERTEGVDEDLIVMNRKKRVQQEEQLMVDEVMRHGNAEGFEKKLNIVGLTAPSVAEGKIEEEEEEEVEPLTESDEDREFRETLMKRVLVKEQAEREAGVDEDTIHSRRREKEQAERLLMEEEVKVHGKILGVKEYGRRRAATLQQDVSNLEFSEDNFDAYNLEKRPSNWTDVRLKRVMLKEHIDRIGGVSETAIVDKRAEREIDEEMIMVGEVICLGRLLGVGETGRSGYLTSPLLITKESFSSHDNNKRPDGWQALRAQRIQYKEMEDRLHKHSDADIAARRSQREVSEEADMVREAEALGQVSLLGVRANPATYRTTTTTTSSAAAESNLKPAAEVSATTQAVAGLNLASVKQAATTTTTSTPAPVKADRIEIRAQDMDPNDPEARPKGWADIKLRKVYLKEWQDRKDGVDEDEIMNRRYQRELEAEEEMSQAITVFGRIQMIENRIQTRKTAAPLFPKDASSGSGSSTGNTPRLTAKRIAAKSNSSQLASRISAASVALETSGGKLGKLAEENNKNA